MAVAHDREPMVSVAYDKEGPGQGQWTYTDYAALADDGKRYEVVDGVLYMAPSPGRWHQETVGEVFAYLRDHIKRNGLGQVFMAPFDVELTPNIVVQPDVIVILNESRHKITDNRIVGAPDLVVEVASLGTATYDRHEKQQAYAHTGVTEYWIVDPKLKAVELLHLEDNGYHRLGIFHGKERLPSKVLPDFPECAEQFFI